MILNISFFRFKLEESILDTDNINRNYVLKLCIVNYIFKVQINLVLSYHRWTTWDDNGRRGT